MISGSMRASPHFSPSWYRRKRRKSYSPNQWVSLLLMIRGSVCCTTRNRAMRLIPKVAPIQLHWMYPTRWLLKTYSMASPMEKAVPFLSSSFTILQRKASKPRSELTSRNMNMGTPLWMTSWAKLLRLSPRSQISKSGATCGSKLKELQN